MKEPINILEKSDSNKREVREVVMQNAEPASTRAATDILVKIFNITYSKAFLKQVADNTTQINDEEITQLLTILEGLEDFFDVILGDWYTEPIDLELNPGSKPYNSKYYLVPRISEEIFQKELKRLVKIGVLTTVQQSQYSTSVFIIPNREGIASL